ncbi:glycine zipper domain-containing protein [Pseudomonas simiae]|uniref:glycine zipper domain-containing protein n=1 Tax=Pseudomonas simiae TaxID=321846 RepID=UPI0011B26419
MRKLSLIEIAQVSGADTGTTMASNAGATLGATAGAIIGGRVGMSTGGAAVGSAIGAVTGEAIYQELRNAGRQADLSGFRGTSFFPQTPNSK